MLIKQRTIKHETSAMGVGLHKGQQVILALRPAPANTGIIFRRIDLNPVVEIPAKSNYVGDTRLCTTLAADSNVRVSTIEHFMSALAGLGIDNLYVDINAAEVPIMDGSASPFVFLLQSAGIIELTEPKYFLQLTEKVTVEHKDTWATLEPFHGFRLSLSIDYQHPVLQKSEQSATLDFTSVTYVKEISRARTFGFYSDYEWLKQNNLALGGSLDNAVVLDDNSVMNKDGLRYQNEFVKHKILDAIGDLYLAGYPLLGHFQGYKVGHYLNNLLTCKMMNTPSAWQLVTVDADALPIKFLEPCYKTA